jgi:hypothetical protein
MDVKEEESGGEPLRIEDLEICDGGSEPTDKAGDNREETVSLESSVHSHKVDESDSSKQVEGDVESNSKSQEKKKRKKNKKSKEGKQQQREAAAGHDSESHDDSSAVSRHQPSKRNLCRFLADSFMREVLYPGSLWMAPRHRPSDTCLTT